MDEPRYKIGLMGTVSQQWAAHLDALPTADLKGYTEEIMEARRLTTVGNIGLGVHNICPDYPRCKFGGFDLYWRLAHDPEGWDPNLGVICRLSEQDFKDLWEAYYLCTSSPDHYLAQRRSAGFMAWSQYEGLSRGDWLLIQEIRVVGKPEAGLNAWKKFLATVNTNERARVTELSAKMSSSHLFPPLAGYTAFP